MQKNTSIKNKARKAAFWTATFGLLGFGSASCGQNNRSENPDKSKNTEQKTSQQIDFISYAMTEYYPELFIAIEELETNRIKPTIHQSESRYTYWNGLTWVYTVDKKGGIHQHPCTGKYKTMAEKMNRERREEQFQLHLKYETFKCLEKACKTNKNLDHKMAVGLCMAGYQLSGHMSDIATRLNKAKNTQEIMDAFKYKLPPDELFREGTLKRRWWCGAYAAGLITIDDILSLEKDAFTRIELAKIATGVTKNKNNKTVIGHYKYDKKTIEYALSMARGQGGKKTVKEILESHQSGRDAIYYAKHPGKRVAATISFPAAKQQMDYDMAKKSFAKKDYKSAIAQYTALLKAEPKDALLWNDLAASYNGVGEYQSALECTNKIFKEIKDTKQYAAAYYNAGVAREGLGEYESALANYQMAKEKGNKAQEVDVAIKRVQAVLNKNGKKRAYNSATQNLNTRMQSKENIRAIQSHERRA